MATRAANSILINTIILYGAPRAHLRSSLDMFTSKLFARRLLGGKVSADCALFREGLRTTKAVGASSADRQLRIDEERSLEVMGS